MKKDSGPPRQPPEPDRTEVGLKVTPSGPMPSPVGGPVSPIPRGPVDKTTPPSGLGSSVRSRTAPPEGGFPFLGPPVEPGDLGQFQNYRIVSLLGRGGMGMVFKAVDTLLQRPVALKVLQPEALAAPHAKERFLREARAMAAIGGDHVVTVHQVGEADGTPWLAMEMLNGESIEDWLGRGEHPTVRETLRIGREIAEGLSGAHAKGLVHRDIKPANLWLEAPRRRVKILDFGLAHAVREDLKLTQTGYVVGTPHYMAPEQVEGGEVDARSDLFSLGCVLYQLSTGELPFKGSSVLQVIKNLATVDPPAVNKLNPALPAAFGRLIQRLLDKRRENRPGTARDVVAAIREIERAAGPGGTAASPAASGEASAILRRPAVLVGAAAVVLLALGWGLRAALKSSDTPARQDGKELASREALPTVPQNPPPGSGAAPPKALPTPDSGSGKPANPDPKSSPTKAEPAVDPVAAPPTGTEPSSQPGEAPGGPKEAPAPAGLSGAAVPPVEKAPPPEEESTEAGTSALPPPTPDDPDKPAPKPAGSKPPEKKPPSSVPANAPAKIYACELKETTMKFVWFSPDSKKEGSPDPNAPDDMFRRFSAGGTRSPHGIGMHPTPAGRAFITYHLRGTYNRFTAKVFLNDDTQKSGVKMRFEVFLDGKMKWESKPIQRRGDTDSCDLPIKGVDRITLQVDAEGEEFMGAHGLWFEPKLEK